MSNDYLRVLRYCLARRIWLQSFAAGLFAAGFAAFLQWLIYDDWLHEGWPSGDCRKRAGRDPDVPSVLRTLLRAATESEEEEMIGGWRRDPVMIRSRRCAAQTIGMPFVPTRPRPSEGRRSNVVDVRLEAHLKNSLWTASRQRSEREQSQSAHALAAIPIAEFRRLR